MTRDRLISYFFIALLIFIIYQIILIFEPFMGAMFWSAIVAFAFYPIHLKIKPLFKSHQTFAAAVTTVFIFLILIPPIVILIVNVTKQAIDLYQYVSSYVKEGHLGALIENIRGLSFIKKIETHIVQWDILKESVESWLLNSTRTLGSFTANKVGSITKNFFFLLLNLVIMIFLVFIFIKDGNNIYNFLYNIAPLEEKNKRSIFNHVLETFAAVIRGQLLTGIIQATTAGIIFWCLALPAPIIFGAATFLTSMVPFIGASGVWVPLVIYLVLQHAYIKAIILGVLGITLISILDNVLKPAIIGEKTKLPYFMLFFGILGGIKLYGIMGIFLAPVAMSLFFALIQIYREKYFAHAISHPH